MVIEGEIIHVMETWPLQVVQSQQGRYDVSLLEQTRILRGSQQVSASELRPGTNVEILGEGEGMALRAQTVRIK